MAKYVEQISLTYSSANINRHESLMLKLCNCNTRMNNIWAFVYHNS